MEDGNFFVYLRDFRCNWRINLANFKEYYSKFLTFFTEGTNKRFCPLIEGE